MNPTPWHFWIVVTLGLVWHLFGVADYVAVQYDWQPWLALMTERQVAFTGEMPDWADGAWALSTTVGLIGTLLLAARASLSALVLSISMFATLVISIWLGLLSDPSAGDLAGWIGVAGLWVACIFSVLLWLYARDMHKSGVID